MAAAGAATAACAGTSSTRFATFSSVCAAGAVYAAGVESGWLLVMYETNNRGVRVGYVNFSAVKGRVKGDAWSRPLYFAYMPAMVISSCRLTDNPATQSTSILSLRPGDQVTYLFTYYMPGTMGKRLRRTAVGCGASFPPDA